MPEYLTIYNAAGQPVGQAERADVHARGLWHAVVHCWVVSQRADDLWVWFQKRAPFKKAYPGYYDIAVGGHISAGEKPMEALLRETSEEIGLRLAERDLRFLGTGKEEEPIVGGSMDRELCHIYLYANPSPAFAPGEEVVEMVRMPMAALLDMTLHGAPDVTGVTLTGECRTVAASQFCHHGAEFVDCVLPALGVRP